MMSKTFQKGDSNRCRTVYERILRAHVPGKEFDAQKKSQRVSVGRCRMLAINYRVALPSYEALSRVRFVVASVPREEWSVPIDCERFEKNLLVETMCRGPCSTCGILQTAGDNDGRQPMAQSTAPLLAFALRQSTHAAEGPESQGEVQAAQQVDYQVRLFDGRSAGAIKKRCASIRELARRKEHLAQLACEPASPTSVTFLPPDARLHPALVWVPSTDTEIGPILLL